MSDSPYLRIEKSIHQSEVFLAKNAIFSALRLRKGNDAMVLQVHTVICRARPQTRVWGRSDRDRSRSAKLAPVGSRESTSTTHFQ